MLRRIAAVTLLLGVVSCAPVPPAAPPADHAQWRPGDMVGTWRVVRAEIRPDPVENGWTGEVDFEGEAVVGGTFQPHPDAEFGALCFFVDEADRAKLPRFPNDVRRPWFCFTNEEEVRRVAAAGKHARIRVTNYRYMYSHTDVYNRVQFAGME